MRTVSLRAIALPLAVASFVASLLLGDHSRAEDEMRTFYSQIQNADFGGAQKSVEKAISLWPSNARYYGWLAYTQSQQLPSRCPLVGSALAGESLDETMRAATDYKRAIDLNVRDAVAHHNLAWLYHLTSKNLDARREWEEAIALDPDTAIYRISYGLFLQEIGECEAAGKQFAAAIELAPATVDSPFFSRYRVLDPARAESVVQAAIAAIEALPGHDGDPILKARLGKFALYRNELPRAERLLTEAASALPNLPLVWFNLGETMRLLGNRDKAWECYTKARFLDAGLAGPLVRMGEIYREAGQTAAAGEAFRWAIRAWAHVNPVTAAHNNRLYPGALQPIDDLLPTTLVWYTSPCAASAAYAALAAISPSEKVYAVRASTCESLPDPHSGLSK